MKKTGNKINKLTARKKEKIYLEFLEFAIITAKNLLYS